EMAAPRKKRSTSTKAPRPSKAKDMRIIFSTPRGLFIACRVVPPNAASRLIITLHVRYRWRAFTEAAARRRRLLTVLRVAMGRDVVVVHRWRQRLCQDRRTDGVRRINVLRRSQKISQDRGRFWPIRR